MHVVLDLERVEHKWVVETHAVDDVPLLHHVHDHLLLLECEVLIHLLPLVDQLRRLHLLDREFIEEGDLEHSEEKLESVVGVGDTEEVREGGEGEVVAGEEGKESVQVRGKGEGHEVWKKFIIAIWGLKEIADEGSDNKGHSFPVKLNECT